MGLGPKYEGQFIPPALPLLPPGASPEMQEYAKAVDIYIQQLHDQLQVTFEKAQQIINQIIYQGDGDGGFSISSSTEEGGTDIASSSPIFVSGTPRQTMKAYCPFPYAAGSLATHSSTSVVAPTNDEIVVAAYMIPIGFTLKEIRYYFDEALTPTDTYYSFALYDENKNKYADGGGAQAYVNILHPAAGVGSGWKNEPVNAPDGCVIVPGWYWVVWCKAGGNGRIWSANFATTAGEFLEGTTYRMIGINSVASVGNAVLPATLSTINALPGAAWKGDPPLLNFLGD